MKNNTLAIPLLSSCGVHLLALLLGSILIHNSNLRRQDFLPIGLVDVPPAETPPPLRKLEAPAEIKKAPAPKAEKPKVTTAVAKNPIAKPEQKTSINEEPAKPTETRPAPLAKAEGGPTTSSARPEGGGSEAGTGNLFGKGDVAVVPGSGTAGGGGGTAVSGLGRGSGEPGLPAQQSILRTNREAKPIQTARAVYPPMALRLGMEADVTLRIIVDPEGNVTKAEIIKSGGAGFDDEALKTVKQSRFEPAQKDGQNIAAEFTYIYRFRLQR